MTQAQRWYCRKAGCWHPMTAHSTCPKDGELSVNAAEKLMLEERAAETTLKSTVAKMEAWHDHICLRCDYSHNTDTKCPSGHKMETKSEVEKNLKREYEKSISLIERKIGLAEMAGGVDSSSGTADILLNPIISEDRFGQGVKNGRLYYGIPIADNRGNTLPSVFYDGKLHYGAEVLESLGFQFSKSFSLVGETWNRSRLHNFIIYPSKAKSTKELLERITKLNRAFVFHDPEGWHEVLAAYVMLTYIFTAFKRVARIAIVGMPGSGKSTQSDLMAMLACNPLTSADMSPAAFYRSVAVMAGLVVCDNLDNLNEESKGTFIQLYDTSFEVGRNIRKCEERTNIPKEWPTFCPMLVNCVDSAWMPQSSITRTLFCRMQVNNTSQLPKIAEIDLWEVEDLKHELRVWAIENVERLRVKALSLDAFHNRSADILHPLLAILQDAGNSYYDTAHVLFEKNFTEHQLEDEFSPASLILLPLWELVISRWREEKNPEVSIFLKNIAERSLEAKGIHETDEEGRRNRYWESKMLKECQSLTVTMRTLPYTRKTKKGNRAVYVFNVIILARFLKSRGFEVGDEVGFDTLLLSDSDLPLPTRTYPHLPNLPTPTPTYPNDDKVGQVGQGRSGRSGGQGENGGGDVT